MSESKTDEVKIILEKIQAKLQASAFTELAVLDEMNKANENGYMKKDNNKDFYDFVEKLEKDATPTMLTIAKKLRVAYLYINLEEAVIPTKREVGPAVGPPGGNGGLPAGSGKAIGVSGALSEGSQVEKDSKAATELKSEAELAAQAKLAEGKTIANAAEAKTIANAAEAKTIANAAEAKTIANAAAAKTIANAAELAAQAKLAEEKTIANAAAATTVTSGEGGAASGTQLSEGGAAATTVTSGEGGAAASGTPANKSKIGNSLVVTTNPVEFSNGIMQSNSTRKDESSVTDGSVREPVASLNQIKLQLIERQAATAQVSATKESVSENKKSSEGTKAEPKALVSTSKNSEEFKVELEPEEQINPVRQEPVKPRTLKVNSYRFSNRSYTEKKGKTLSNTLRGLTTRKNKDINTSGRLNTSGLSRRFSKNISFEKNSPLNRKIESSTLSDEQTRNLTQRQIQVLTIPLLQNLKMNLLTPTQVGYIDINKIQYLKTEQVKSLSPDQIKALSVDQLNSLSNEQLAVLSIEQLAALSNIQVGKIKEKLPPEQISLLEKIEAIKLVNFTNLTSEELAGLTIQIPILTILQLQKIKPEIFAKISTQQLAALTPKQFGGLTSAQIKVLSPEQIREISPEQIKALPRENLNELTKEQKAALTDAQKNALKAKFGGSALATWLSVGGGGGSLFDALSGY